MNSNTLFGFLYEQNHQHLSNLQHNFPNIARLLTDLNNRLQLRSIFKLLAEYGLDNTPGLPSMEQAHTIADTAFDDAVLEILQSGDYERPYFIQELMFNPEHHDLLRQLENYLVETVEAQHDLRCHFITQLLENYQDEYDSVAFNDITTFLKLLTNNADKTAAATSCLSNNANDGCGLAEKIAAMTQHINGNGATTSTPNRRAAQLVFSPSSDISSHSRITETSDELEGQQPSTPDTENSQEGGDIVASIDTLRRPSQPTLHPAPNEAYSPSHDSSLTSHLSVREEQSTLDRQEGDDHTRLMNSPITVTHSLFSLQENNSHLHSESDRVSNESVPVAQTPRN